MLLCDWRDFSTESETYTRERFEEIVGDEFEAMMVDEHGFPKYIWTVNQVIIVTVRKRIVEDVAFDSIPRNPVCQ
ncbi:MAG: hypothetical protein ACRC5C_09965 [Bacilli bacterium]